MKTMPSEKTVSKASENRRSTKPIMEKRRRARINHSLSELKNLILDALKKDNARHSKLEKADILEMTVKHLQGLQRQQQTPSPSDPSALAKFRAGFAECANEVSRFMGRAEGADHQLRQRLLNHLANCLTGMNTPPPSLHVNVEPEQSRLLQGVQLVPTRLPSGDIAFIVPSSMSMYSPGSSPISMPSGILSPAASDRLSPMSCPSPVIMSTPTSVIVPRHQHKVEAASVWRPF